MKSSAELEEIHRLIDDLPEDDLPIVRDYLYSIRERISQVSSENKNRTGLSHEFLQTFGSWQDERSADEIIEDVYGSRTSSHRVLHL